MNTSSQTQISGFNFDNSYSGLPGKLFTRLNPVPVKQPSLVLWNKVLAAELGLNTGNTEDQELADIFSGNTILPGSEPLAQAYAGHQFGHFTMLGDGRAVLLGEQITPDGRRMDIQLKGSGQTPYSRRGDGRATLYSMLREYLISEAIHHLGIPTSRSLAVVETGDPVYREFTHKGAVLTRVASSHIRVGTFEYVRAYSPENLPTFFQYVIERHYPHLSGSKDMATQFLREVMQRQTDLIVNWLRVGLIHGVMNTDNMTISGETIDYGPCAFINAYHPKKVFSSIDHYGRYAFGNQPSIAHWNLSCLALSLLPLFHEKEDTAIEMVKEVLGEYEGVFNEKWLVMMCRKIGIELPEKSDRILVEGLLNWMAQNQADYTNTFLFLEDHLAGKKGVNETSFSGQDFQQWLTTWEERINQNKAAKSRCIEIMQESNPTYIPRNHKVEEALEMAAFRNNFTPFSQLSEILSNPYSRENINIAFQLPPENGDVEYKTFCGT